MKIHLRNISCLMGMILLLVVVLPAQSYFGLLFPPGHEITSTKSLAMGMTGAASEIDYANLFTNPALITAGEGSFLFTVDGNLRRHEEQRSYPVYDMFDDVVADNIYVSNRHWYSDINAGLVMRLPLGLTAGFARTTFWDLNYDYLEEVRGSLPAGNYNRDPLAGYHEIHNSGRIFSNSLGVGYELWAGLKLGFAAHLLTAGEISNQVGVQVILADDALAAPFDTTVYSEIELDDTPIRFSAGIAVQPYPGLQIGINYNSDVSLTLTGFNLVPEIQERTLLPDYVAPDTTTNLEISLPSAFSIGVEAHLSNPIATKAVFEIHNKDWSSYKMEYYPAQDTLLALPHNFSDAWEIHAGVEHILFDTMPFRFGIIYTQSPLGDEFEATHITVGGGYKIGPVYLDAAAIFGSIGYNFEDLFVGVDQPLPDYLEMVEESQTRVNISVSVPF